MWLILAAWLGYTTGVHEEMIFGVCTVFTIVALGLPALMFRIAAHRPDASRTREPGWPDENVVETYTGRLSAKQAATQILLVPGAVAVGFTAIAIVEVLVRHSA
ncbi:MAG: hypothetical protein ACE5GS_15060 [Kiloniellaceae bacterium]